MTGPDRAGPHLDPQTLVARALDELDADAERHVRTCRTCAARRAAAAYPKTWDSVRATARPGAPFSNGFEWEAWAEHHCWVCVRDAAITGGCPLAGVAMLEHVTPVEWVEEQPGGLADRYRCEDFVPVVADRRQGRDRRN